MRISSRMGFAGVVILTKVMLPVQPSSTKSPTKNRSPRNGESNECRMYNNEWNLDDGNEIGDDGRTGVSMARKGLVSAVFFGQYGVLYVHNTARIDCHKQP